MSRDREDLLDVVGSLTDDEWLSPTDVPGWTVKDLALHILDDDLGWLSRGRDGDRSGLLNVGDSGFVDALNQKNQRWVDAAGQLSRCLTLQLLEWAGGQMDAHYAAQSLTSDGYVSWASDDPVPNWFDLAQDLTERWVHQMQIREAVDAVGTYRDDYLPAVMRTLVWAFPHQYRVAADPGSRVLLDLAAGGAWTLTSDGARWDLAPASSEEGYVARVRTDDTGGWRWLTGGDVSADALDTSGPVDLIGPLMKVRAALV